MSHVATTCLPNTWLGARSRLWLLLLLRRRRARKEGRKQVHTIARGDARAATASLCRQPWM
jgi:hypothetical protein